MLKKTIAFTDFDGTEQKEDFYFNLTKAEIFEVEVGAGKEGLSEIIKNVVEAEDGKTIIEQFKKIILASVGKRSEDGKLFIKNQDVRDSLEFSPAYSELFMELATDADKASAFVNGVLPADLTAEDAAEGKTMPKDRKPKAAAASK